MQFPIPQYGPTPTFQISQSNGPWAYLGMDTVVLKVFTILNDLVSGAIYGEIRFKTRTKVQVMMIALFTLTKRL